MQNPKDRPQGTSAGCVSGHWPSWGEEGNPSRHHHQQESKSTIKKQNKTTQHHREKKRPCVDLPLPSPSEIGVATGGVWHHRHRVREAMGKGRRREELKGPITGPGDLATGSGQPIPSQHDGPPPAAAGTKIKYCK